MSEPNFTNKNKTYSTKNNSVEMKLALLEETYLPLILFAKCIHNYWFSFETPTLEKLEIFIKNTT